MLITSYVDEKGNLQLMKNPFGYCVRGYHPSLQVTSSTSNHIQIHVLESDQIERNEVSVLNSSKLSENIQQFLDMEGLGVQTTPKCGGCICGTCSLGNRNCTLKEERELHLISDGLTLDEREKKWTVRYPWIRSPRLLPNNYLSALSRMKSVERRLTKRGIDYCSQYNNAIQDMIDRNVARALTTEELEEQHIVYYLPHHEVVKQNSSSKYQCWL